MLAQRVVRGAGPAHHTRQLQVAPAFPMTSPGASFGPLIQRCGSTDHGLPLSSRPACPPTQGTRLAGRTQCPGASRPAGRVLSGLTLRATQGCREASWQQAGAQPLLGGTSSRSSCGPHLPHVAGLGLIHHQQVRVHLIHQLRRDPAQRHPQLVSRHKVVLLLASGVVSPRQAAGAGPAFQPAQPSPAHLLCIFREKAHSRQPSLSGQP